MKLAPIILFCYNRADHTKQTIDALKNNYLASESDLYIFCDGPKNEDDLLKVQAVHQVIDNVSGFKSVTIEKKDLNRGLAKSVIYGVSKIVNQCGKVIVLEDDVITNTDFLEYINQALEFYKDDPEIFSVTGFNLPRVMATIPKCYQHDIFFIKGRNASWGWAIWQDRWNRVDFKVSDYGQFKNNRDAQKAFNKAGDNLAEMLRFQMEGKVDSWSIRAAYHCYKHNLYTLLPVKSLIKNIGIDGSGTHKDNDARIFSNYQFDRQGHNQIQFKHLKEVTNNDLAQKAYIADHQKKFFAVSKKKRLKIIYFLLGLLSGSILTSILK